jgi:hypothetical protein
MASISRDSQTVWPSAVRHVGRCWLIAFPAGFLKTFAKQFATPRTRSRRLYLKKYAGCDLLHEGLRSAALNHHNGSENRSIITDSALGCPCRLCRDCRSHRRDNSRTGLFDPDLTALSADHHTPTFRIGCSGEGSSKSRSFWGAGVATETLLRFRSRLFRVRSESKPHWNHIFASVLLGLRAPAAARYECQDRDTKSRLRQQTASSAGATHFADIPTSIV